MSTKHNLEMFMDQDYITINELPNKQLILYIELLFEESKIIAINYYTNGILCVNTTLMNVLIPKYKVWYICNLMFYKLLKTC